MSTFAGSGSIGNKDGLGTEAQFAVPAGMAMDLDGNLFVADLQNHRIRKVTPQGQVSTLAGSTQGYQEGLGAAAQFDNPNGVAVGKDGNLYVADTSNHRIRKITPQGQVTTFAGSTEGYQDGQGTAAQFDTPLGVTVDKDGNVYVAD